MRLARLGFAAFWLIVAAGTARAADQPTKDYPVRATPLASVHVQDEFWRPRLETNRTVTLWYVLKQCEEHGEFDNFAKAAGAMPIGEGFRGSSPARDSDAYKTVEGAAYTLAEHPDAKLEEFCDALIANIARAQEPDGYVYTARKITPADKMPEMAGPERFKREKTSHETYVMGLLQEAGVAYEQATGKRMLLDTAVKSADFLDRTFGPGETQLHDTSGHEEVELALVRLYQATGSEKYLKLAQYFVDERGRHTPSYGAYAQDHKPVVDQTDAVGHAVRAGYLYCGVTDLAALTGNPEYAKAIDALWHSAVDRRMYITGGVGARRNGEAFGNDYELPNLTAYNETCAAVANAFWQQRMFLTYQDAKYVDVLERILYNGFLGGISLSGDRFFYTNALESDGSRARSTRMPWFAWPCCLTNDVRLMPSIPGYSYATGADTIYVNLFMGSSADLKLGDGTSAKEVRMVQETRYPLDGNVKLTLTPRTSTEFSLRVRIPGWAQGKPVPGDLYRYRETEIPPYTLSVNGQQVSPTLEKGYAVLKRTWKAGDTVELNLPMPIHRVLANAQIEADKGRVALERGPLVYCIEGIDNGDQAQNVVLPDSTELVAEHRANLLGGVTVLRAKNQAEAEATPFMAIPYYAWSNRGDGQMCVWIHRDAAAGSTQ
jgi:DUF1680 family protein